MTNDEGFNHDAYWNRIGKPTTRIKKSAKIRYPLLHILHKILVGAFVHRMGSRDKVQKADLWLLILLDEGHNANVASILAVYLSRKASGINKESDLMEVIVNGDSISLIASASAGVEGPIPLKTAEQKLARKIELKAKSTLMLAIPDEHLLKFHACKGAKSI
ncbi:hypothetical protein Tco_1113843 [Tanacetum coccineum]|uniref:Uncharacterized protein n=1 Tax=Tanacetum coccineum TaxID=301880 RepID=A0ABQ5IUX0_9ASTR